MSHGYRGSCTSRGADIYTRPVRHLSQRLKGCGYGSTQRAPLAAKCSHGYQYEASEQLLERQ